MKKEIWKDIPGYEGEYQASTMGRIKSLERYVPCHGGQRFIKEKILKQHVRDKGGHLGVSLGKSNQGFGVHRAVALAFIGTPDKGQEVLHINGNPKDNRPENLRYGTRTENILDVFWQGKSWKKLDINDVEAIRFGLSCGMNQQALASMFDVSKATIYEIKVGRRYAWLK